MILLYRIVVVIVSTIFFAAESVLSKEITYESYLFSGDLKNYGIAGGPVVKNKNLSFTKLPNGKLVAENSLKDWHEPQALVNMNAKVPVGLQAIRVAAWIKTKELNGIIRRLHGTGIWSGNEIPNGIIFSFSGGRLAWDAHGYNARSNSIRGVKRVNDGCWHYVAAVCQLAQFPWSVIALYIDGQLDAWYRDYDSNMTPQKIEQDDAFGFKGQMSKLELQSLESGPSYFTGSGENIKAIPVDPLYDANTIPIIEKIEKPIVVKSKNVVSVEDFGVAGNGITDDTEAILSAVAALNPKKGIDTLFFSEGTYKVSKPIQLPNNIDIVGLRALIKNENGPVVELVGEVHDISFRGLGFYGGPPAAVYQHKGVAKHLYFESCSFSAPDDGKLQPGDANNYSGRTSDGIRFTNVQDSTMVFCNFDSSGRAGLAVEGTMSGLSVLRCLGGQGGNLTGFYFDTIDAGPSLLLGNTIHCNRGYLLTAKSVQNLVVRQLSSEGLGCYTPAAAATGPIIDIRNGTNVDIEHVSLATMQMNRNTYQHNTWNGPAMRINGTGNTLANVWLFYDPNTVSNPSFDSDDPDITLWNVQFHEAVLKFTGNARRRNVLGSYFKNDYSNVVYTGFGDEKISSGSESVSPETRNEPVIWGPPEQRFNWGELPGLINVKNYGATGDSTKDDSEAINRAIASGGVVYIPAGTYRIGHPILINKSEVTLIGDGKDKTILVADNYELSEIIKVPGPEMYNLQLIDMKLRGGDFGVNSIAKCASTWFLKGVRFEEQSIAGFNACYIDNGNIFFDCEFIGAKYGFVGGGMNPEYPFMDKTMLWRCTFDSQTETAVQFGPTSGVRALNIHTVLRDCTIRNAGRHGIYMTGQGNLPNIIDHCLIEDCNRNSVDAPYIVSPNYLAMYHTIVRRNSGQRPNAMITSMSSLMARLVDVQIIGAQNGIAIQSNAPFMWFERVMSDGKLEVPENLNVVYTDSDGNNATVNKPDQTGLVLIEHSQLDTVNPR